MTAAPMPDRITHEQLHAALDALGLGEYRDDIHHLEIEPHEVQVYAYRRNGDGRQYLIAPGTLASGITRIPVGDEPERT